MTDAYPGQQAFWGDKIGTVTRLANTRGLVECRNLWWSDGDTEFMFSLRRDGVWRMFPGAADAEGLELLGRYEPGRRTEVCPNGHERTPLNTGVRREYTDTGKIREYRMCLDCRAAKYERVNERRRKVLTSV